MPPKKETPISESEKVVCYELILSGDRVVGIGNSFETTKKEAVLLIQQRKAKHESAPVGKVPDGWLGSSVEVVKDGNSVDQ